MSGNEIHIPRCMSTQHPDNATPPFFSAGDVMGGDDEVREAHYVFKTLGCDEQMWDHEGKEVDQFVVSKLFSQYGSFFKKKKLGKNVFLTLRVPNPVRERNSAKVLLEVLESIPRAFDTAKQFYGEEIAPVFEVILPMTTSAIEVSRIWHYYQGFVVAKSERLVVPGDITLKEWIGEFAPSRINVIPLIEDKPSLLSADTIVEDFVRGKGIDYQRVFLARSDPALAYGSASAVLMIKLALYKLHALEKRLGIPIYPVVGVGTAPFRGHFNPTNIKSRLAAYPSVQTFTVQSAFKFDYPEELVKNAISRIKAARRRAPIEVEDEILLRKMVEKISHTYSHQVESLAPLINEIAKYTPPRRKRKLHVGLFGYTRAVANKRLPRAIGFCAALYSIGLPPELLGLSDLKKEEIKEMLGFYPNFIEDIRDSLSYFDSDCLKIIPARVAGELYKTLRLLNVDAKPNVIHQSLSRAVRSAVEKKEEARIPDLITQAARERRFLG